MLRSLVRRRSGRWVVVTLQMAGCGTGQLHPTSPLPHRAGMGQSVEAAGALDVCPEGAPGTPLDRYVGASDGAFRWDTAAVHRDEQGTLFDLRVVSQRWRGTDWRHSLLLFVPEAASFPDLALLVLRDGAPGDRDAEALRTASRATGAASAYLYQIPNQPLFGGREEDALLAHTYAEFLRTGDESWPLLFPMVRSVVRAMDVIGSLHAPGVRRIDRYVVAGHSKRGHTAWLAAAVDPRVAGVVPLAIDVLNSRAQIDHHRQVAGEISASSSVFAETLAAADSPRGRCLIAMIDPYTYRDRLTEPKLVVLGTNDDYTPVDALDLYWRGLSGPKSVLYLPNTTHSGVNSHPEANPTAFAFVRAVGSGSALPEIAWTLTRQQGAAELRMAADLPIRSARLWTASSAGRDFRSSTWSEIPVGGGARSVTARLPVPATGYTAMFGEVELLVGGVPFKLSTPVQVVGNGPAGGAW